MLICCHGNKPCNINGKTMYPLYRVLLKDGREFFDYHVEQVLGTDRLGNLTGESIYILDGDQHLNCYDHDVLSMVISKYIELKPIYKGRFNVIKNKKYTSINDLDACVYKDLYQLKIRKNHSIYLTDNGDGVLTHIHLFEKVPIKDQICSEGDEIVMADNTIYKIEKLEMEKMILRQKNKKNSWKDIKPEPLRSTPDFPMTKAIYLRDSDNDNNSCYIQTCNFKYDGQRYKDTILLMDIDDQRYIAIDSKTEYTLWSNEFYTSHIQVNNKNCSLIKCEIVINQPFFTTTGKVTDKFPERAYLHYLANPYVHVFEKAVKFHANGKPYYAFIDHRGNVYASGYFINSDEELRKRINVHDDIVQFHNGQRYLVKSITRDLVLLGSLEGSIEITRSYAELMFHH